MHWPATKYMSKKTGEAIAAIAGAVNWECSDMDLYAIIEAAKQGVLGPNLTAWLANKEWRDARIVQPSTTYPVLEFITKVGATSTGKFFPKEKFVVNTGSCICVKISAIGENLIDWFLSTDPVMHQPVGDTVLRSHKLLQSSADGSIILECGGVKMVITDLTYIFDLMSKQSNGEKGDLINNGWYNIFYVPQLVTKLKGNRYAFVNKAGRMITEKVLNADYLLLLPGSQWMVLRVVYVRWNAGGWVISANHAGYSRAWDGGDRVFSRSSEFKSLVTASV